MAPTADCARRVFISISVGAHAMSRRLRALAIGSWLIAGPSPTAAHSATPTRLRIEVPSSALAWLSLQQKP